MAREIKFDAGDVTYTINGVEVSFNPTDTNFVERLYNTFTELEKSQSKVEKQIEDAGDDGAKIFKIACERDKEMRSLIDKLLGKGISNKFFKNMNVYALGAQDKAPVWTNLFLALAEEVADRLVEAEADLGPQQKKFTKKYEALMAKYNKKGK